ncbi:MAG: transcription-repair coupling factor, partial [Prevotellamassilia sp.]|nr:transcription-repair coupling factor [Prevotellamassilia sp.]
MQISELLSLFTSHPGVSALRHLLSRKTPRRLQLCGLQGSAAPMIFAALAQQKKKQASPWFFILNDEEEAGYFYHDLRQLCGDENVLFFPSSYRRAAKYARRDAANDILRTEVLNRLTTQETTERPLMIVTFPAAITEKVAAKKTLTEQSFTIKEGDTFDLTKLSEKLLELGFRRCDYVYEPGEFAVRGSILDVFSFSSEHPYRIDFFGDDVESLRTFEVQTQLSAERRSEVSIVPDTADSGANTTVDFVEYVPDDSLLIVHDLIFVADTMNQIYKEGFSKQAEQSLEELPEAEAEELRKKLNRELMLSQGTSLLRRATDLRRVELVTNPDAAAEAVVCFHTSPQPLFHKNFELLREHFDKARAEGNRLFILADSAKQNERLQHILDELTGTENADHFTPVTRTLHAGFSDQDLHLCCFTDHQIFDRFHKYNLKSDHARDSKMALTLKELMQFEVGDYV